MEEDRVLAEMPFLRAGRVARQKKRFDVVEQNDRSPLGILVVAMMSAALSVARVLENIADLLLGVAISSARDVGAIDEYHDDFIRITPGRAVIAEPAAQLVAQALGHRRLADADTAMKEKAFQRASLHMLFPLVVDDGR